MDKYTFETQPRLRMISDDQIKMVHEKALHMLETAGVKFESEEALKILKDHGRKVDFETHIAKISPQMVDDALRKPLRGLNSTTAKGNWPPI
jgi:trimethylamine---corrinoid protein Co-methyltransferase